jgi:hypothetical protein
MEFLTARDDTRILIEFYYMNFPHVSGESPCSHSRRDIPQEDRPITPR